MKKPDLKTRIEHYKKAIAHYESWDDKLKTLVGVNVIKRSNVNLPCIGMCFTFAEINDRDYFGSPWTGFTGLQRYYPELSKPESSLYTCRRSATERLEIVKSALAKAEAEL